MRRFHAFLISTHKFNLPAIIVEQAKELTLNCEPGWYPGNFLQISFS